MPAAEDRRADNRENRLDTAPARYASESLVPLRIAASDLPLRAMVKAAGGRWNPDEQLWFVRYGNIAGTPLEKHIPVDANRAGETE
jgi:hypothetical protein